MKQFWSIFLRYLPYIIALFPVMIFRDFTPRNELRYLTIADEALRDDHYWSFSFLGEPYADKPPLYLWLLMSARWLFGSHIRWIICLFSLLPALGILHIMDQWTRQLVWPGKGDVASSRFDRDFYTWMTATMGLQLGLAVFARMDMLMSFFIVWSLYLYWQKGSSLKFGVLVFLALFSKGPFGVLIPLLVTFVWMLITRDYRTWCKLWSWRAWLVLLVGCTVWFVSVYREGGADYLNNMLFHQTVDRAVEAFHHKRPWYFYLLHLWYTTLPWGPLALVGIGHYLYRVVRHRTTFKANEQDFFVVAFLVALVLLSSVSGKLDVYLLPVYAFLSYGGLMEMHCWCLTPKSRAQLLLACRVLLGIIFVAGCLLPFLQDLQFA